MYSHVHVIYKQLACCVNSQMCCAYINSHKWKPNQALLIFYSLLRDNLILDSQSCDMSVSVREKMIGLLKNWWVWALHKDVQVSLMTEIYPGYKEVYRLAECHVQLRGCHLISLGAVAFIVTSLRNAARVQFTGSPTCLYRQSGEIGETLCDEQKYYHIKIVSESEHDLVSSETAALLVFVTFSQQPTCWIKSTSPFRHTTDPKLRMFRWRYMLCPTPSQITWETILPAC